MKIAIVDDIVEERSVLRGYIASYLEQCRVRVDFYEYCNRETFLLDAQKEGFTVVFLDIYLDGIDGMEAARMLRQFDENCILVFVTTSPDYALDGFKVRAMHYLVKPFSSVELERLLTEILERLPNNDQYIEIKSRGEDIRLYYSDIVYAEHFSHRIYIYTTAQKVFTTRQSFRQFVVPLQEDSRFFICSRGVIVNLEHACDFEERFFIMDEGSKVLVNRDLAKEAHQTLMIYLLHQRRR